MTPILLLSYIVTLVASIAPEIFINTFAGGTPPWLLPAKACTLAITALIIRRSRQFRPISVFVAFLAAVTCIQIGSDALAGTPVWIEAFNGRSLASNPGGSIALKLLSAGVIIGLLMAVFRGTRRSYLVRGDLSVRAERIAWLGIESGRIRWSRLSVISGLLISAGTLLSTMFTVTGFTVQSGAERIAGALPLIVLLAIVNSFAEGIVYRNMVLASLRDVLPRKHIILLAALYFGIAHFYGAPGGPIGIVMAGALGWFMCRSMVETGGFLSSWIIHAMQDMVIFSTFVLMQPA